MSVTTLLTEGWRYGRPQASVTVGWAERNESGQVMERYTGLVKGWGGEFLTTADGELCAGRWAGIGAPAPMPRHRALIASRSHP